MDESRDEDMLREHDRKIATTEHDLRNLRQIVDIKLEQIKGDIGDLRNVLKWAGGLIVSLMLSFMAWALLQQYNANEAAKTDMQHELRLLQQQETQRNAMQLQGDRIEASQTRAAEAPAPAPAGR